LRCTDRRPAAPGLGGGARGLRAASPAGLRLADQRAHDFGRQRARRRCSVARRHQPAPLLAPQPAGAPRPVANEPGRGVNQSSTSPARGTGVVGSMATALKAPSEALRGLARSPELCRVRPRARGTLPSGPRDPSCRSRRCPGRRRRRRFPAPCPVCSRCRRRLRPSSTASQYDRIALASRQLRALAEDGAPVLRDQLASRLWATTSNVVSVR
jgi:hypothetical protein